MQGTTLTLASVPWLVSVSTAPVVATAAGEASSGVVPEEH